jgi:drug/metabolite transporter (DMT)-like permease
MPRSQLTAVALASLATATWGTPPVISRALSVSVPPLTLAYSRWAIGLIVLLPFVWHRLAKEWPKLRPHAGSLTLLSLFMISGTTLSTLSVYYTTATNAVLVNAVQPAVTAVIAFVVTRDRLRPIQALGVACAFAGIVAMISRADISVLATLDIAVGDLIMLIAVFGWSLYAVYLHRRDYLPPPEILLFFIALVGTVALLPLLVLELYYTGGFEFRPIFGVAMLYLAAFPTVVATLCWNQAIHTLGANRAAVFTNLIPVFGAAFAMIFLGERLYYYHLVGAALVFVGIYLAVRYRTADS